VTKEIFDSLETWEGGKTFGYYEPFKDEIHILRSESMMFKVLLHERIHASRKDKLSFKLAEIIQIPVVAKFLFGIFIVLAIYGIYGNTMLTAVPAIFIALLFTVLMGCITYEEYVADSLVARSVNQIKRNGEKEDGT
jgi:hypothetical protein